MSLPETILHAPKLIIYCIASVNKRKRKTIWHNRMRYRTILLIKILKNRNNLQYDKQGKNKTERKS